MDLELPLIFDPSFFNSLHALLVNAVKRAKALPLTSEKEIELEVRLGLPKSLDRKNARWRFDSAIGHSLFSELQENLEIEPIKSISTVLIRDHDRNTRIRKITAVTGTTSDTIYQVKTNIDSADQLFLSTSVGPQEEKLSDRNVYMLRFSLAEEVNTVNTVNAVNDMDSIRSKFEAANKDSEVTRQRERYSYPFGDYNIDLTIIDYKEYTIELEFTKEFLKSIDAAKINDKNYMFSGKFLPPVKKLIKLLFPSLHVVWGLIDVTPRYFQLLEISTGGAQLSDVQPQNIMESQVPDLLSGYSFTNKLNGSRFRVMISTFKYITTEISMVFIISNTEIRFVAIDVDDLNAINTKAKFGVSKFLSGFNNSLVDVELFVYKRALELHAFDCPVFQGEIGGRRGNNTLSSHDERISVLRRGNFDSSFNKLLLSYGYSFEIKRFFYTGNLLTDFEDVLRYMYARYGDEIEECNDGLINTPIGSYEAMIKGSKKTRTKTYYDRAYPIFKWKYPSTVSIDFTLDETDEFTKDKLKYKVFTVLVSDNGKLVLFGPYLRGKYYNPPSVLLIDEKDPAYNYLQSGQVVELGFDRLRNSFRLMRVRTDKTEPNLKFPTAEATFVDMETEFRLDKFRSLIMDAMMGIKTQPATPTIPEPAASTIPEKKVELPTGLTRAEWRGRLGPQKPPSRLDVELFHLYLLNEIRSIIQGRITSSNIKRRDKDKERLPYEADNILERWLIAMANLAQNDPETWSVVFKETNPNDPLNQKLASELLEKKIELSKEHAVNTMRNILEVVHQRLQTDIPATGFEAQCYDLDSPSPYLSYGSEHINIDMSPRLRALFEKFSCEDMLQVLMRYRAILSRGQQWGLPQSHFDKLYDRFGVRHEAFGSPINSRLMGKPGATFGSIFIDTDAKFGSIGNFFNARFVDYPGNWQVNPPFTEDLLNRAAEKVVSELIIAATQSGDSKDIKVFFLMPAWTDSKCYSILKKSKYLVTEFRLNKGRYQIQQADGKLIPGNFDAIYFVLSSAKVSDEEKRAITSTFEELVPVNIPVEMMEFTQTKEQKAGQKPTSGITFVSGGVLPGTAQVPIQSTTQVPIQPSPKGPCLVSYRTFHNRIKTGLINSWTRSKRVLDLGAGKGGDLAKYSSARVQYLWVVEPNKDYVTGKDGFVDRLKKYSPGFQKIVDIIQTKAEDSSVITNAMIKSKDDKKVVDSQAGIVSSFFSMSFFFKDEPTLKSFIKTVIGNLSIGGKFIGTMMDGQRAFVELKDGGGTISDPENCYYIKQKYPFESRPLTIGNEIGINLSGTPTVQNEQTEWLASFEYLQAELEKENMFLIESLFFDDSSIPKRFPRPRERDEKTEDIYLNMTPGEKRLNRLYRYFVFERRKEEPSPVSKQREQRDLELKNEREKNSLASVEVDETDEQQIVQKILYPEPLYRVGVIGKGSCFFHSILFLLTTQSYTSLELPDRAKETAKVRTAMALALSPEKFSNLGDGNVEYTQYLPYLHSEFIDTMITQVKLQGDTPTVNVTQINEIMATAAQFATIEEQITYFTSAFVTLGFDSEDIEHIIEQARLTLWTDYRTKLESCSAWTTHDTMEYIMRSLKRNIFVIADSTRLPVKFTKCEHYNPNFPSIVILNLEGLTGKTAPHFEPVVEMMENEKGEAVSVTNFPWTHPLVQSLYNYLCIQQD